MFITTAIALFMTNFIILPYFSLKSPAAGGIGGLGQILQRLAIFGIYY